MFIYLVCIFLFTNILVNKNLYSVSLDTDRSDLSYKQDKAENNDSKDPIRLDQELKSTDLKVQTQSQVQVQIKDEEEKVNFLENMGLKLALGSLEEKNFSTYKELKVYLIELISQAKERVYISTDLFADPDMAASLFVAKFKKRDVIVVLDPKRASDYRSKVSFFLDNGISVYAREKSFHTKYKTLLIIDKNMYTYRSSLVLETKENYSLVEFLNFNLSSVVEEFEKIQEKDNASKLKRPKLPELKHSSYPKQQKEESNKSYGLTGIEESVYEYDRYPKQKQAPPGVDTKLPRQLKSTKR